MKKIILLTLSISLITFAIFKALFGPSGFIRQLAIDDENHKLQIELDSLEMEIIKKNKEIVDLKTNWLVIEKKARTEMGMTKEGEIVFRFRNNDSTLQDSATEYQQN